MITSTLHKIEIWFWKALISILKTKPTRQKSLSLLVLGCLLLTTALWGINATHFHATAQASANPVLQGVLSLKSQFLVSAQPYDRQNNTLLVLVDRLPNKHPRLVGVWMLISPVEGTQITLVSIYPERPYGTEESSIELARDFALRANGQLGYEFLQAVRRYSPHLDQTLVMDLVGLQGWIAFQKAQQIEAGTKVLAEPGLALTPPWEDPVAAARDQNRLFTEMCRQPDFSADPALVAYLTQSYPGHVLFQLEDDNAQPELSASAGLECKFPGYSAAQ